MTTQFEGTSSIDGCVCQERYYKAADGGCLACPVGSTCPEAGVVLASLSITVGESAPAHLFTADTFLSRWQCWQLQHKALTRLAVLFGRILSSAEHLGRHPPVS